MTIEEFRSLQPGDMILYTWRRTKCIDIVIKKSEKEIVVIDMEDRFTERSRKGSVLAEFDEHDNKIVGVHPYQINCQIIKAKQ